MEFASAVDAVACAVAMQEGTAIHQRGVPPESGIVFRMGINVGDVVVEDGDLLGDSVNIAARLEALAEPGGICIADAVQKQLVGKSDFAFEDTGTQTLKNIAQPVRSSAMWRLRDAVANRGQIRQEVRWAFEIIVRVENYGLAGGSKLSNQNNSIEICGYRFEVSSQLSKKSSNDFNNFFDLCEERYTLQQFQRLQRKSLNALNGLRKVLHLTFACDQDSRTMSPALNPV